MRTGLHALTLVTAALAAAVTAPASAQSARLSLADRVARLEQEQAQGARSEQIMELLQRIAQLQAEVQSLRGLVEQQGFEIEALKKRARDQYVDLDARLARLEGGAPPQAEPAAGSVPEAAAPPVRAAEPGVTTPTPVRMEEPEVRPPVETPSSTQGIGADAAAASQTLANPAEERRVYDAAFEALKEGRYAEAARRFQGFLKTYPDGEFAPNAHYWLGESYYVTQNYQIALDAFRSLLERFPSSSKAPDALLKIGYCQYELRQWAEAEATLNQVIERYPDSTVARLAQGRLRALRLERRQ